MLSIGKPSFWRSVQPVGAAADFGAVWRQAGVRRWPFVAAALCATLGVFYVIVQESWKAPPARPSVVYINSWTADRSDAEIAAEIAENQKLQDRLAAEQAVREAKVKEIYRTLGRASGMDVAAIEAKAKADAAAEKAAREKAIGIAPAGAPPKNGAPPKDGAVARP